MRNVIITAPSLDPTQNVSGVSSVVQFIIENNSKTEYRHFEIGKKDNEKGLFKRLNRIIHSYCQWKRFLDNNADSIIHYSFPLSAPSILRDPIFMSYALRKNRKLVVHVHGGLYLTAKNIPWLLKKIMKWVFSQDVPFIVLSEGEKKILQLRFGTKRIAVLPNCPDLSDAKSFARVSYDGNRPIQIGYLGRIEPNKGMTELLDACVQLQKEGVEFVLNIAGKEQTEGEYLPKFQSLLGKNFHYSGLVSGSTKSEFLRNLDIFAMPTYFEGLPVSLLECMSYGVVPVVTPVGSIPDVVKNGENGLFVEVKNISSIVDAIKRLNGDLTYLSELSVNAKATIFNIFSVDSYISKLNDIYSTLEIEHNT